MNLLSSLSRRLLMCALVTGVISTSAVAETPAWPVKPISLVVPYAAGGLTDQLAREVATYMSNELKQAVVVDNRPGGAAHIGMNVIKTAPADGYAVFFGDVPSLATNLGLFKKLSYDPRKDLQAVTQLVVAPALVVVPTNSPYRSFEDLVTAAKASPDAISYASQGVGTGGHLFGTLMAKHIDATMTHVAYRGSLPGLSDLMGGQVNFMYDAIPTSGSYVYANKLRALAIGSDQRAPSLPDVPTLKELGYGSIVPTFWWGVAVKAGTPQPVVDRLNQVITAAMHDPVISKKITEKGVQIKTSNPEEFGRFINDEIAYWTPVMRAANMSAD
ncbi:Bug family tripartite tricarboxylate transporter substrate binding protein [Bordetella avium]|uniref:Bug family tripartite tricarboxylate transporter substrate binding protein n=1 Tax=Bordetella avium TaxID=521 RepID=UPI000E1AA40B|nr:tripartite tricarboxylate transporter substrate binding protein [Bordetella avium]WQE33553.1 tripartite tricarboxylate transporter substrate binding protein [Bordetella avium]SUV70512.1 putattive exported protein [Bordetella avium]